MLVREFGPPSGLELSDLPTPEPGPGEVRLDVRAIGVNFPDVMLIAGTYQRLPELPFSPGKELSGVVSAIGSGVTSLSVGDAVRAQVESGAYQSEAIVDVSLCHAIPQGMSFEQAAGYNLTYLTAYYALVRRAQLKAGETVLVTAAAGGVGTAGIQIARALGATVIGYFGTPSKRPVVEEAGAHHVIDSSEGALRDRVLALTEGRGADVVLEMVGGSVFESCLRCTAWEGRVITIGFASGEIPTIKAGYLLVKNMLVAGLQVSDYRDRDRAGWQAAMEHLDELYRQGLINPIVSATYPLERAAEALAVVQRGEVTGKIVLIP